MKTPRLDCRSALAAGIAGAFFLSLTAGPASASCGYAMKTASLQQPSAVTGSSAVEPALSDWQKRTKHPLRGEFPYAAAIPLSEQMEEPAPSDWQKRTKHPLRGEFPSAAGPPQAR